MRKFILFTAIAFLIALLLATFLAQLLAEWRGREFTLLEGIMSALIFVVGIFWSLFSSIRSMYPSLKYLEDSNMDKPVFEKNEIYSSVIDVPENFAFNNLKAEITEKMVVTFSDGIHSGLKFRTRFRYMGAWGIGAWLKYDRNARKLYLEWFSLCRKEPLEIVVSEVKKYFESSIELQKVFAPLLARYDDIEEDND